MKVDRKSSVYLSQCDAFFCRQCNDFFQFFEAKIRAADFVSIGGKAESRPSKVELSFKQSNVINPKRSF